MKDQYKSLAKYSEGIYREKGSKFIAYAFPIAQLIDFEKELEKIKKEHFKARHHCYAYRLAMDSGHFRANDDGEPNGSAGLPILNQLKAKEVFKVACVVVRYFGGTKLGVAGLIRAYKSAALDALEANDVIEKIISKQTRITFGYDRMGELMNTLKKLDIPIINKSFEATAWVDIELRSSMFEEKLISLKAGLLNMSIEEFESTNPKMESFTFESIAC